MRRHPDLVPAGELAAALGLKPSTLSSDLAALMRVGLIRQARDGTLRRYGVDMAAMRATLDYLWADCCRGRPELCLTGAMPAVPRPPCAVLFLCTGNSARSIFAEAILRAEGGGRFLVRSAGTQPAADLHPLTRVVLRRHGHDVAAFGPRDLASLDKGDGPRFDFLFTLCDRAANEECPAMPGQPLSAHWGLPDPRLATGSEAEEIVQFEECYNAILNRVRAFAALPFDSLDRLSLQRALDRIGRIETGEMA